MLKKFSFVALAGALVPAISLISVPAGAQEVTLRMQTFIPPVSNPAKTFLIPWAKKVGKASNGRLKIQQFWTMQLGGKPNQLVDQVKDGVVDIIFTLPGYTAGRFPKSEVFELPFVHTNSLATTLAMQDYQDKHLGDEFKDYKVLLLHVHNGNLFMTKRPVTKVSDLKGMKIRTATRSGGWYLKSLGAVAIGAPLPQIPQMLSKGVIDGALLPYEIAPAIKMQELTSHFSELAGDHPRVNTSVFSFLMNKAAYNKLSSDLKKVIDGLSGRGIAAWAGQTWSDIEVPGKKVLASKKKNKFHIIPASEVAKLKAAAQPAIDRWLEQVKKRGINGNELLSDARSFVNKHTK